MRRSCFERLEEESEFAREIASQRRPEARQSRAHLALHICVRGRSAALDGGSSSSRVGRVCSDGRSVRLHTQRERGRRHQRRQLSAARLQRLQQTVEHGARLARLQPPGSLGVHLVPALAAVLLDERSGAVQAQLRRTPATATAVLTVGGRQTAAGCITQADTIEASNVSCTSRTMTTAAAAAAAVCEG